jgi:hypothetical protein
VTEVFLLFRDRKVLGVYDNEKDAVNQLDKCPDNEYEYVVESWPINCLAHKFNTMVVRMHDSMS